MLSTILVGFLFSPALTYAIGLLIILAILIIGWIEWKEYSIRKKLIKQNIRYVRLPSLNMALMRGKRIDLIEMDISRKYGKVFGGNMLNEPVIYVTDPELAQIILTREFTKFANRRNFEINDPVWDNFLFSANDERWKRLRAIVSPTFSSGKLRKVKYCIDENFEVLRKNLNEKIEQNDSSAINIKEIIGAFTLDTIIQISMGMKINSLKQKDALILKYARQLFSRDVPLNDTIVFVLAFCWPSLLKILGLKLQPEAINYFRQCSLEIIRKNRERIEKMTTNESFRATNFIELILEVELEQKQFEQKQFEQQQQQNGNAVKPFKHVTNDELIAQCILFFTVGYDTTATTITHACYTMATNPDKQEKLYHSIMETLEKLAKESDDDNDNDPYKLVTFDTLNQFDYLDACLNETMRLLTLATTTERVATDNIHIETNDKKLSFDVQKGDVIRIPFIYLHNDERNFSDPEKFIPERFLSNGQQQGQPTNFNKNAFMPFGSGPRKCVASNLALMEAKVALIHLFRLYRLSVNPKLTKIPLEFYINNGVLVSKDVTLSVEKR